MLSRILGWLRPKAKSDEQLKLLADILKSGSHHLIIETSREMFRDLDPNGCVMAMVGYKNMKHIYLPVSRRLHREQTEAGQTGGLVPDSIEQYAEFISATPTENEPAHRRQMWFMYGLFLMKSEVISECDGSYKAVVDGIFDHLSQYRAFIVSALAENILWTEEEKDTAKRNIHPRHRFD